MFVLRANRYVVIFLNNLLSWDRHTLSIYSTGVLLFLNVIVVYQKTAPSQGKVTDQTPCPIEYMSSLQAVSNGSDSNCCRKVKRGRGRRGSIRLWLANFNNFRLGGTMCVLRWCEGLVCAYSVILRCIHMLKPTPFSSWSDWLWESRPSSADWEAIAQAPIARFCTQAQTAFGAFLHIKFYQNMVATNMHF